MTQSEVKDIGIMMWHSVTINPSDNMSEEGLFASGPQLTVGNKPQKANPWIRGWGTTIVSYINIHKSFDEMGWGGGKSPNN